MKVYIVTRNYENNICGIFSKRDWAEIVVKHVPSCNDIIEEFELDALDAINLKHGYKLYFVRMKPNGDKLEVYENDYFGADFNNLETDIDKNFYATVLAKDEKHAYDIVNEKRIKHLQRIEVNEERYDMEK